MYARTARDRQLDSVQVLRANRIIFTGQKTAAASEIVVAAEGCVHPERLLTHACPPLPLRTGWAAQHTCECSHASRWTVLQCAGMLML